ncbi:hypothetical protein W97_00769 [Coniosporium apollinis CBS 100218]|uniref:F-box domain-containing protein n=1 Tax=Coniosporium apollinis (strain CBS 100218) TaxID=1168221 RepID=R7YIC5_CONA1|nr:uncharacterized protein W97_00769 [Coniosporium apollinis CBS 100218]EON61554.1 hypothetical protein W97_00769 [Coniosporium apollinis CBS 100218]
MPKSEAASEPGSDRKRRKLFSTEPEVSHGPSDISHFPFLQLPGELRNQIYEYALAKIDHLGRHFICLKAVVKKNRRVTARYFMEAGESSDPVPAPRLLGVNKQIRGEATPILYSVNTFGVKGMKGLLNFLSQIGPSRAWLKDIWIHETHQSRHAYAAYNLLAQCTRLTHLKINCDEPDFYTDANSFDLAKCFYRDAHPWLEAVGAATGDKIGALDILDIDDECITEGAWSHDRDGRCAQVDDARELFFAQLKDLLDR